MVIATRRKNVLKLSL